MTSTIKDLEDAAATLDRAWRDMEYAHRAPYRVAANQDETTSANSWAAFAMSWLALFFGFSPV